MLRPEDMEDVRWEYSSCLDSWTRDKIMANNKKNSSNTQSTAEKSHVSLSRHVISGRRLHRQRITATTAGTSLGIHGRWAMVLMCEGTQHTHTHTDKSVPVFFLSLSLSLVFFSLEIAEIHHPLDNVLRGTEKKRTDERERV